MIYKAATASFTLKDIIPMDENGMVRTASSKISVKQATDDEARKIIESEIKKHPKALFFKAKAIVADETNSNGDFFSRDELIRSYSSFVGVPFFTNHDNQNVENARGKIIHAEWDEEEKAVYVVGYVDREAYPHICRGIEEDYMTGVSMGCSVEYSVCSICHNKATSTEEYCNHIKFRKGRKFSGSAKDVVTGEIRNFKDSQVYETNYGIRFIELSGVGDPACRTCRIEGVFDNQECLKKAANIQNSLYMYKESAIAKQAGQQEVDQLEQCIKTLKEISVGLIQSAPQVELEFPSDLVKILAQLQEFTDELVGAGYGQFQGQAAGVPGVAGEAAGAAMPPAGGEQFGIPPQPVSQEIGAPAGAGAAPAVGTTTGQPGKPMVSAPTMPTPPARGLGAEVARDSLNKISEALKAIAGKMSGKDVDDAATGSTGDDSMKRRTPGVMNEEKRKVMASLEDSWQERQGAAENRETRANLGSKGKDGGSEMKRVASETEAPDQVTERQLDAKGIYHPRTESEKDQTTQAQLEGKRTGTEQDQTTQAQLEGKRTDSAPDQTTQVQLAEQKSVSFSRKEEERDQTTQAQLDAQRTNVEQEQVTEAQLWKRAAFQRTDVKTASDHLEAVIEILASASIYFGATPAQMCKFAAEMTADMKAKNSLLDAITAEGKGSKIDSAQVAEQAKFWGAKAGMKLASIDKADVASKVSGWLNTLVASDSHIDPESVVYVLEVAGDDSEDVASKIAKAIDAQLAAKAGAEDTVKVSKKEAIRQALKGNMKQPEFKADPIAARKAERAAIVAAIQKPSHVVEASLSELGLTKADIEAAKKDESKRAEVEAKVVSFAANVSAAYNRKFAGKEGITNVDVKGDEINIAISWNDEKGGVEGDVSLSVPGSEEDLEPDVSLPEGDINEDNIGDLLGSEPAGAAPAAGAGAPAPAPAAAPGAIGAPAAGGLPAAAAAKGQMKKQAFSVALMPDNVKTVLGSAGAGLELICNEDMLKSGMARAQEIMASKGKTEPITPQQFFEAMKKQVVARLRSTAEKLSGESQGSKATLITLADSVERAQDSVSADTLVNQAVRKMQGATLAPVAAAAKGKAVKTAQTPSGGGMGAQAPMGGAAEPADAAMGAAGPAMDPGVQTFTDQEATDEESVPGVGEQMLPGSICPFCKSTDTNVGEEGREAGTFGCNNCGAIYKFSVNVELMNPTKMSFDKDGDVGKDKKGVKEPKLPEMPVAAEMDLTRDNLVRIADLEKKLGHVCPACGTSDCKPQETADGKYASYVCPSCQTKTDKEVVISTADPEQSFMRVSWNVVPSKLFTTAGCKGCREAAITLMAKKSVARMVKEAAASDFPMANCMERIARRYGSNAVATFGPCKGKPLSDCVCKQLKEFGMRKSRILEKFASLYSQPDPMDKCVEDHSKKGLTKFQSKTICEALRKDNWGEDDENMFIAALDGDKDFSKAELRAMHEMLTQMQKVSQEGPMDDAVLDEDDSDIGEALPDLAPEVPEAPVAPETEPAAETVTVELPKDVAEDLKGQLEVATEEPAAAPEGEPVGEDIVEVEEAAGGAEGGAADQPVMHGEFEAEPGVAGELEAAAKEGNSMKKEAKVPDHVEHIETEVEAGIPRGEATIGKEGKDNINVTMKNGPDIPRGSATMGKEGPANIDVATKKADLATGEGYIGHEKEVQKDMPGLSLKEKGTIIAEKEPALTKEAKTPTMVKNVEKEVEAKVPRGSATIGNEGKDNIDVAMKDGPDIPRGKATMGGESAANIDKPMKDVDVPSDSAFMGGEKAVQQGMPALDVKSKGTVIADSSRDEQIEKIAKARKDKASKVAARYLAAGLIQEAEFDAIVDDLAKLSYDRIESFAARMFSRPATVAAQPQGQQVLASAVVMEPSQIQKPPEETKGDLLKSLQGAFTVGSHALDGHLKSAPEQK